MIDRKCIGEYDKEKCSIREECKRYVDIAELEQDFLIHKQVGKKCKQFVNNQ